MRAIVVGAGEVGLTIARHLVAEHHDIVLIDKNEERLKITTEHLDVKTVQGNGAHPSVLEESGCAGADMIIAVTDEDEVNMVACQIAHTFFSVPKKIARVRESAYLGLTRGKLYTPENMPVDTIISPEQEVAEAILRALAVPGAFDASFFADGKLNLIGTHVAEGAPIIGVPVKKYYKKLRSKFTLMAIYRGNRLLVPEGADHLEEGDEVFFLCKKDNVKDSMSLMGFDGPPLQRVLVIGGGNIGFEVCQSLEKEGLNIRVLEQDLERAEELADVLSTTTVLHGDALDRDLLLQENIGKMDVVLSVTSNDSANILSSILAKQLGAKSVITLITQPTFIPLAESLGLDQIICPQEITISKILQNTRSSRVINLHTMHDGKAEVAEIEISEDSPLIGQHLNNASVPDGVILGGVKNLEGIFLAHKEIQLHERDRVTLFFKQEQIEDVENLF